MKTYIVKLFHLIADLFPIAFLGMATFIVWLYLEYDEAIEHYMQVIIGFYVFFGAFVLRFFKVID